LRRELRVDAGRSQEEQTLDIDFTGCVKNVHLDLQVFADEVDGKGVVGKDAAHFRGGEDNVLRPCFGEELEHCSSVTEIEFRRCLTEDVLEACTSEPPNESGTGKSAMAGDVEGCFSVQLSE
jgi:hypothetical protein